MDAWGWDEPFCPAFGWQGRRRGGRPSLVLSADHCAVLRLLKALSPDLVRMLI
jgi:hypothetical protein